MTLAADEPEVTEFSAHVKHCDGTELVLDESYFYPESGGQPADRGTIAGFPVVDVQKRENDVGEGTTTEIVHTIPDPAPEIEQGAAVTCEIDEEFRTYCMRAHTASHALYGAGRRLLSDLGYGGFGITDEKIRVDFATSTEIDDSILVDLERLVNEIVWESRPVDWERLPRDEALSRRGIAFNTKTEEGVSGTDLVRVVTIEGRGDGASEAWDVAACGGTHVRNTREIGPVTVLGRSNPGEGLTRVEYAVGHPGIDRRTCEKRVALDGARALGTPLDEVPVAIERLQAERDGLAAELDRTRDQLIEQRIEDLRENVVEHDGATWLVGTVEADANELADRAGDLAGERADVVVLLNDSQLAVGTRADGHDAGRLVSDLTDEFGGGGGGSPTLAQAGGLETAPETVVETLRDGYGGTENSELSG